MVGVDRLGNRYFENLEEQHGRHRWVEYNSELGHRESSRIQPEWHGWMHHMTDAPPSTPSVCVSILACVPVDSPVRPALASNDGSQCPRNQASVSAQPSAKPTIGAYS